LERTGRVSEVDVANAYKVFLGRPPEAQQVILDKLGLSIAELILQITQSEEFVRHVAGLILSGEIVNSPRYKGRISPDINIWAKSIFNINSPFELISKNKLWSHLIREIVLSAKLNWWSEVFDPNILSVNFEDALLNWSISEKHSAIIGGIDLCDPHRISGWVINRDALESALVVEVFANGRFAGAARADRFRRDLQASYGGDGAFGFGIDLKNIVDINDGRPIKIELVESITRKVFSRTSIQSQNQYSLDALSSINDALNNIRDLLIKIEAQIPAVRRISSFSVESYNHYVEAYELDMPQHRALSEMSQNEIESFPLISVIITVPSDRTNFLDETITSLLNQRYERVELCIAYEEPRVSVRAFPWIDALLSRFDMAPHQHWPEPNSSRGAVMSAAIKASRGSAICCINSGDLLGANALHHVAKAINSQPRCQVFYSDEDEFDRIAQKRLIYHTPKFNSRHDALTIMQVERHCGLVTISGDFLRDLELSGKLDRDEFIRMIQICDAAGEPNIYHIARVLLHRSNRPTPPDTDQLEARRTYVQARQDGLGQGGRAEVARDPLGAVVPGCLRLAPTGLEGVTATVIIPTRDNYDLLRPCIEGLIGTMNSNTVIFNIVVVDNGSKDQKILRYLDELRTRERLEVMRDDGPFNWAALNNDAVTQSSSDVVIFLNDDMLPIVSDWCDEMCFWALRSQTGAVGTRLLYEDGSIQHAGVVGGVFGLAAHEGVGAAGNDPGYLGRHALVRKAMAVTGACMAVRRSVFEQLGGFDADTFAVAYNDLDFCLRAGEKGLDIIYTPYASFYHFESKSRGFDFEAAPLDKVERSREANALLERWGNRVLDDATYNPHFDRWTRPFTRLTAVDMG
jgi:GT2 family glycosyltransferase